MNKLKVLDLFSGIGGFSLGLERTGGFEAVAFCEIEPFPRKVLAKHWPGVPIYEDVTKLTGGILARDGIAVDVITGGFPCQDISTAGKQAGISDGTRSGLWSEIVRLIGELSPRYVIVENVANLLSGPSDKRGGWFGRILGDLAECGYDAEWENIPAAAVGACHRRERVWVTAYPNKDFRKQSKGMAFNNESNKYDNGRILNASNSGRFRQSRPWAYGESISSETAEHREANKPFYALGWPTEPAIRGANDGLPSGVVSNRLAALGNAVVPQIPEMIGRAIMEAEGMNHA